MITKWHIILKKWYILPLIILGALLQLLAFATVQHFITTYVVHKDFIFWEMPRWIGYLFMGLNIAFGIGVLEFFNRLWFTKKRISIQISCWSVVVWLIGIYVTMTSVTAVTKHHIIFYSPLNISGTVYAYSDVKHVDTYIVEGVKFHQIPYEAGDFHYVITMKDGHTTTFNQPVVSKSYEDYRKDDTYLELEEFDVKLVGQGVSKTSNLTHIEKVRFDVRYKERFRRIIENKK